MARKKKKRKLTGSSVLAMILWAVIAVALAGCVMVFVFGGELGSSSAETPDVPDTIAGLTVHTDYISRDSKARLVPGRALLSREI